MHPSAIVTLFVAVLYLSAIQAQNAPSTTDKAFVSGGTIEMQLESGDYDVRPGSDQHIRVTVTGQTANTKVDLTTNSTQATLAIKDPPRKDFRGTIDVPKVSHLVIHLSAGNLTIGSIVGNKDIDSTAGNIEMAVGDPNEYSSVDASVKAGDINAAPFGGSKSGLFPHFTWSGKGKHTLRVRLGAGNVTIRH
jgi:hypothetical protein